MRTITTVMFLTSLVALAQATPTLETVATGLSRPVTMSYAPNDLARIFVIEQRSGTTGRIRIVKNGVLLATPFLSVSGVSTGGEQGLLGLAFHPNYPATPYFYINFTNSSGATQIVRYQVSANPDIASTTSSAVLTISQPYSNHNGGSLAFGADGNLYIGMGDGGSGNDPENRAQNVNSLLGKFLRINVDSDDFPLDAAKNYAIPSGNMTSGLPELWSYGWRNPWQWGFDLEEWNGFGGLIVADVGQSAYEEVDYERPGAPAGLNYGWRVREGMHNTGLGGGTPPFVDPIFEYGRSAGVSISGGTIYRGVRLGPELWGRYLYSDYGTPILRGFPLLINPDTGAATAGANADIVTLGGSITAIRPDASGELYAMSTNSSFQRITDQGKAIRGRVVFTGLSSEAEAKRRWVSLSLKEIGGAMASYTFTLKLKPDGSFRIPGWARQYELAVKKDHWLRRKITVDTTGGDVNGADLVLINGDVDGDNIISIFDYIGLSDAFDSVPGDANFVASADLDEDGVVSVFDYIILSENFDMTGDAL